MKTKKSEKRQPAKAPPTTGPSIKMLLPALVIITTLVYFSSLSNGFTNWDDNDNVTANADVRTFHGDSVGYTFKKIFSINNQTTMYAPLARLTYCMEFQQSQLEPRTYHLTNLLLHLLNTLLVFWFIWLLVKQPWVAFITALLFSIHPLHVESVAWITGRVDVLYSLFYLAALCFYVLYLKNEKRKWQFYSLAFILFVFSLLSKAAAVTLPVVFFAIDYFLDRKLTTRTILEKAPFIVPALILGYITITIQKPAGLSEEIANYTFFERILFSCYAMVIYVWKLIAPVNLSCLYNYPVKGDTGAKMYPAFFYIAPLLIAAAAFFIYKWLRTAKDALFGLGFFIVNIILILPGLVVRHTIVADRYTYIASIGLFFIVARWLNNLWLNKYEKYQFLKMPATIILGLFLTGCFFLSIQRTKVWHDSITLWSDAIEKEDGYYLPFYKRGIAYSGAQQYDSSVADFTRVIQLRPDFAEPYNNRGNNYSAIGKYDEAVKDYTTALHLNPALTSAYYNRADSYSNLKKYSEALTDYDSAIAFNPNFADALLLRGNTKHLLDRNEEAIEDYSSAIAVNPNFANAYNNRAVTYFILKKFQPALDDALKAQQMGYAVNPDLINEIQQNIKVAPL